MNGLGQEIAFRAKSSPRTRKPSDVPYRRAHAQALLRAIDGLGDLAADNRPGVYLEFQGRPNEPFVTKSLDTSGLRLLSVMDPENEAAPARATVFATSTGVSKLRKKVEAFEAFPEQRTQGDRPKNADLVQSISVIVEAGLRALWRSPPERFPAQGPEHPWEIWLNRAEAEPFLHGAERLGIRWEGGRLEFPEDVVIVGHGTHDQIATAVRQLGTVKALAVQSRMIT